MTNIADQNNAIYLGYKNINAETISGEAIIYVLGRADNENISKVGSTKISAESRASSYTDGDWTVHSTLSVPSILQFTVERFSHEVLKKLGHWLPPNASGGSAMEIFTCPPAVAKIALDQAWSVVRQTTLSKLGVDGELIRQIDGMPAQDLVIQEIQKKHEIELSKIKSVIDDKNREIIKKDKEITELWKKLEEPFLNYNYKENIRSKIINDKDKQINSMNNIIKEYDKIYKSIDEILDRTMTYFEDIKKDKIIESKNEEFFKECIKLIQQIFNLREIVKNNKEKEFAKYKGR